MSLSAASRLVTTRPFIFFTVVLLIKSYIAWLVTFDTVPTWQPFVTEMPFMWLAFCLIECFAGKRRLLLYNAVNLLFTSVFFAVIMYYKYFGIIVTYHALEQVNQVTAVKNSVFSLLDPYFLFIFTDILIFMAWSFRSKYKEIRANFKPRQERRTAVVVLFTISFAVCLMNIWPNRASMNEIKQASEMGILNYEAYTIFNREKPEPVNPEQITEKAIMAIKGIQKPATPALWKAAQGKNLIVIQLESFQNFLLGLEIDGQEVTPNMNRLMKEHFYFPNFYQQVGQGNTSDAEFVVNTSFYIPPRGAATMAYAGKVLPSMPRTFQQHGYDTATFHTNMVEFWNRGELYKGLGFDRYYDQAFFGNEDTVFFGPSDEVLYRKTAEELDRMQQAGKPFYAHVISMTAHHPFSTPKEKDRITLPERYQDTLVGDYLRAQSYADAALGGFISDLQARGLWDNSLIVIYGDHLGLPMYSLNSAEEQLMKEIYGRDYSYTDMINIPLIIASAGITKPAVYEQIGGQVDLFPTIANLLGISLDNQIYFGQDLFNQNYNILPQRYYLPTGSFLSSESLFMPGNGFEDGTEYPLADPLAGEKGTGHLATEDEYNRALQLLHYSDSYVIQLPDREAKSAAE
ncbi:LTA synthase family protein [Paenibacillus sp. GCM10027626]|uniref:LTA synthase family protein n=1 Tax=Paenibacillus sp. GCM10027626 TaxID=3273411 RepID=UPI003640861F